MAIPENQLETWTHIGAAAQSAATYQSIKGVIESSNAPYASRRIDSFLQGSYGNDTNVYGADSDVDIVLRTKAFFHYNLDSLSEGEKTAFRTVHPTDSKYQLANFRDDAIKWLYDQYKTDLDTSGKKALRLKATDNRRSSDILLVAPHRKYTRYYSEQDKQCVDGVMFITTDGTSIINYPKQHSENMTWKHQNTEERLKPTVRIFKNMRNRLIRDGKLKSGSAPSYFIEGMLYNVPANQFVRSRQATVENCWGWINNCNSHADLTCANGIHPLVRDNTHTSWSVQGYIDFLEGVRRLWQGWPF
ncbi:nucleotidyltransferase domain-containing protein [Bradyrhizobium murdochi]|uniref:nucleotidyltransferase domain-containing protein n=1 Tax=Bradyrhizobium murdochi TaxID=1038859 RepID=UPI0004066CB3|nr:nucleotidyltransferase [Bradyrhizobium murdochi]